MYTDIAFRMGTMQRATADSLEKVHSALHGVIDLMQGGLAATPAMSGLMLGRQAVAYAEDNVARALGLARGMMHAHDVGDVIRLQSDYLVAQLQASSEQIGAFGATVIGAVTGTPRQGRLF